MCYTHFHSNKVFRGDPYYGRRLQRKNPLGGNVFRIALRDDPDVILIGEMRDYETISLAMTAAETGLLVFGTLHTSSAAQTIDRIIDVCPPHSRAGQVRNQLSNMLQGIIAQSLVPRSDRKGRVAAVEVMLGTDAVKNLIRSNKIPQMETVMLGSTPSAWNSDPHREPCKALQDGADFLRNCA
ncbi:MAG: ATPase, T2SS/T4P/T4SS family [Oscillospiraceae bacterium]